MTDMTENDGDGNALLRHLASMFRGNTEDVATEALRHLLDKSMACREALNDVLQSGVRDLKPVVKVRTQVIGLHGTRPDLVGFDEDGKERALVEVKFWADLTSKQPDGYLKRLPDDGPAVLMFLVPARRIEEVWSTLRQRLEGQELTDVDSERRCMRVGDSQRHLMLVSWTGLLDSMAARSGAGRTGVENEILQLRNLARHVIDGAYKPLRQDEKFDEDSDRRMQDFQRLVDDATEEGIKQGWASRKGLTAATRAYGFGRYVRLSGVATVWFGINKERFEETGATPLWVELQTGGSDLKPGVDLEVVRSRCGISDHWYPVGVKRDVEYSDARKGVVEDLKRLADALRDASPSAR